MRVRPPSRQLRTDETRDVLSSGLATPRLQPLEAGGTLVKETSEEQEVSGTIAGYPLAHGI